MSSNITLKNLTSQISKLKQQYEAKKNFVRLEQQNMTLIDKQIKDMQNKIDNFGKNTDTVVSEHAILRYLERVKGVDIESIKKEILTKEVKDIIDVLGTNGKIPNGNFRLILKDNIVTTVTTPN